MQRTFSGMIGLFVLAALFMAPAVMAQDETSAPVTTHDFTAEELDAFAEAYVDVEEVQARYESEQGAIEDPEEAVRVQAEYEQEIAGAVEARGLNAERYDQIVRTSQADVDFAQELLTRINDVRQRRAQG